MPKNKKQKGDKNGILFFINKFKRGGAERRFVLLANELYKRGYSVRVGTMYSETEGDSYIEDLELPKEFIQNFNFNSPWDRKAYKRVLNFIRSQNIGIIYSSLEDANIVARLLKISQPSLNVCVQESNVANKKINRFKLADIVLNTFADKLIAVSEGVKKSMLAYQPHIGKKVYVFERPVEVPEKEEACCSRDNEAPIILAVGSLTPQKRHDILIEAFAKLKKEIKDSTQLIIVGEGREREKLEQLANELNVSESITFTGSLPHSEVEGWYKKADIFAITSEWEGSSSVVREAMAHCLPVVGTDIVGVRESVKDGEMGYLVPSKDINKLANKLEELLKDKQLREEFGERGYEEASKKYNLETHIERLLKEILT